MKKLVVMMGMLVSLFSAANVLANDEFPGRAEYPEIAIYEKDQLADNLDNVVIVDARSSLEFETLRIKGAVNIPVANKDFAQQVIALRAQTNKPIVFYCNGRDCYKSYKAADISSKRGVKEVYAYDAGMFEWAQSYPQHAVLLGNNPIDPTRIIPKDKLKARFLDPKTFTETARAAPRSKSLIVDVRDLYQRAGIGFFPGREKWISLDEREKLNEYIKKAKEENRTLYIYDEAGKQVRWLQYTLEHENVKDYFFMDHGAKGFYKTMIY